MSDDAKSDRKKSAPERAPAPKRAPERAATPVAIHSNPGGLALPAVAQLGNRATLAKLRQGGSLAGGTPLDPSLRKDMEHRFDADFGTVRIHRSAAAEQLASGEHARAFTLGHDIVFGKGEWSPSTTAGRSLLAHELAHVRQQELGHALGRVAGRSASEADANRAARAVEHGMPVRVAEAAGPTIQRQEIIPEAIFTPDVIGMQKRVAIVNDVGSVTGTLDAHVIVTGTTDPNTKVYRYISGNIVTFYIDDWIQTLQWTSDKDAFTQTHAAGYRFELTHRIGEGPSFPPFDIPDPVLPPNKKPPQKVKPPPVKPKVEPKTPEPEPDVIPVNFPVKSDAPRATKLDELRESLKYDLDDVGKQLQDLTDDDLTDLAPDDREGLLDWLTKNGARGSDVDNQDSILRLLHTTPESDARAVIESLRADDALLTQKMLTYMDWRHQRALHESLQLLYFSSLWGGYTVGDLGKNRIPMAPKLDLLDSVDPDQLQLMLDGKIHIVPKKDPFGRDDLKQFDLDFLNPKPKPKLPIDLFGTQPDSGPLKLFEFSQPKQVDPFALLFPYKAPRLPIIGKHDALTDFLERPKPEKPVVPLSDQNQARLDRMEKDRDGWLSTLEIRTEFEGAAPLDRQLIAEKLGDDGMTRMYDAMGAEEAVILGSQTPLVEGRDKLNQLRAELIARLSYWAPRQRMALYAWIMNTMTTSDLRSVLGKLAEDRYLKKSLLAIPGIDDYMKQRGIELDKYKQIDGGEGFLVGSGRGLWKMIDKDENGGLFITKIPEPFQKQIWDAAMGDVKDVLTPGNIARGVASEATMGFSEIPFGLYGAGAALISGGISIYHGDTEDAGEKIAPVAAMIVMILVARKVAAPSAAIGSAEATALEEEGLLGPKGPGQFSMKGSVSTAAKNVESVLAANPRLAAASGALVDQVGVETLEKAAGYMQADAAATRLVLKRGVPALQALVNAEGDVAAAEAALDGAVPKTPKLLPAPKGPPPPPLPGMSTGEAAEQAALDQARPGSTLLPDKTAGYDGARGSTLKIVGSETRTMVRNGVKVTETVLDVELEGGEAIQIKTATGLSTKSVGEVVLSNVRLAVDKAWKQFHGELTIKASPTPLPGQPTVFPRINVVNPDRITIVVQVGSDVPLADMVQAQTDARAWVAASTKQGGLPPIDVVVQYER